MANVYRIVGCKVVCVARMQLDDAIDHCLRRGDHLVRDTQ